MIGRMPAAIASSAIEMMFSTMCWVAIGPLFCARSFVPARITTACGWRLITSARKRQSIWPVTCPPIPRQAKLFAVKNSGWALSHPVGDRVAHEHHRGRGRELRIGFGIAAVVGPVALLGRQQGRKCERDQQNQFFHGGRYFF